MHLGGQALGHQRGGAHAAQVIRHVPVERIDAALTARAPEHLADAETDRGCDAVGGAGGDRHRIGEQHGVRIEDQGEFIVSPERIDLGEVGEIEGAPLQAGEVGHHLQPGHHRVHIEVRLVEAAAVAVALRAGEARGFGRRDAGIEVDAAQRGQTERFAHHLHMPRGFPEADGQADDRIDAATADGAGRVVGVLLVAEVGDACAADTDRQDAGPADVGDRIGKLARAGRRTGGQGRQSGKCGKCGQYGQSQAQRQKDTQPGDTQSGHRATTSSSMRSRSPSWETSAGTCLIPRRRVSRPCWS